MAIRSTTSGLYWFFFTLWLALLRIVNVVGQYMETQMYGREGFPAHVTALILKQCIRQPNLYPLCDRNLTIMRKI
jgi:hypothetical protein